MINFKELKEKYFPDAAIEARLEKALGDALHKAGKKKKPYCYFNATEIQRAIVGKLLKEGGYSFQSNYDSQNDCYEFSINLVSTAT